MSRYALEEKKKRSKFLFFLPLNRVARRTSEDSALNSFFCCCCSLETAVSWFKKKCLATKDYIYLPKDVDIE